MASSKSGFRVEFDDTIFERIKAASDGAALEMAEAAYRTSQQTVPVRTGRLKRSGRVEGPKDGEAAVVYGGPDAPYAAFVERRPGGRGFGYLRRATMDARQLSDAAARGFKQRFEQRGFRGGGRATGAR